MQKTLLLLRLRNGYGKCDSYEDLEVFIITMDRRCLLLYFVNRIICHVMYPLSFGSSFLPLPLPPMAEMEPEIPNVSSWRLNKKEKEELEQRVKDGEDETEAKRDIQRRKAKACEERKKAAAAIAAKNEKPSGAQGPPAKKRRVATPAATAQPSDPTNAAYYALVEADLQRIAAEFPGLNKEKPLALTTDQGPSQTGVQEPYDLAKGKHALATHGVYRCSMSLFSLNVLGTPTPGIPMSRTRVLDMAAFYYPEGKASYMTGRMVEVYVDRNALSDTPENLQMISPEEIVHSMLAACAEAIERLGHNYHFSFFFIFFSAEAQGRFGPTDLAAATRLVERSFAQHSCCDAGFQRRHRPRGGLGQGLQPKTECPTGP